MRKIKNNSGWLLVLMLVAYGCGGLRTTGSSGNVNRYVESYFKGEGKMLYFIKPVTFSHKKERLEADFTYNQGDTSIKNLIVNLSIIGKPPFVKVDSVKVSFGINSIMAKDVVLAYNENVRSKKYSRQGFNLPASSFGEMLKADPIVITLFMGGVAKDYVSGKTWRKKHQMFYDMIFM